MVTEPVVTVLPTEEPGNHAAERRCDDRHLRRAAARPTCDAVGERDEEVRDARALQKRAEDDEQHDVGAAHVDGRADHARSGVEELLHDLAQRAVQVAARGRRELPIERVRDEAAHHDDDGKADAAPAQLHQDERAHHAERHVQRLDARAHEQDVGDVLREVEERPRARDHQDDVVPRNMVDLVPLLANGVDDESDDDDAGEEARQTSLGLLGRHERHHEAVDGEQHHDGGHDDFRDTLPNTRVRLLVVLAHDLIDIDVVSRDAGWRGRHDPLQASLRLSSSEKRHVSLLASIHGNVKPRRETQQVRRLDRKPSGGHPPSSAPPPRPEIFFCFPHHTHLLRGHLDALLGVVLRSAVDGSRRW